MYGGVIGGEEKKPSDRCPTAFVVAYSKSSEFFIFGILDVEGSFQYIFPYEEYYI
ncbi:MAG: hypothetical protein UW95_C0014G0005 [Parcubacteria group bacterium GW2011_GWC1_45_14]|nr:MAG: hypothetical protein UW95_C0014G0005 [Parcubacteria group bacterium GW2011_GWC1_45_14]